jgi:hypothetical protein
MCAIFIAHNKLVAAAACRTAWLAMALSIPLTVAQIEVDADYFYCNLHMQHYNDNPWTSEAKDCALK